LLLSAQKGLTKSQNQIISKLERVAVLSSYYYRYGKKTERLTSLVSTCIIMSVHFCISKLILDTTQILLHKSDKKCSQESAIK